ncbi:MAG: CHAT domain-containing protein [Planctomycetota bacterium]
MQRSYPVGDASLEIHLGDITQLEVDAIVSSENSDLIMDRPDGASVSAAIRRLEGDAMAHELERLGPLPPGRAVALPAKVLPCRWVIHAASVERTEDGHRSSVEWIRDSVRAACQLAQGLGLGSLAFPAFGVRAANVAPEVASAAMVEVLVEALSSASSLERVVIALLDAGTFLAFFEQATQRATRAHAPRRLTLTRDGDAVAWSSSGDGALEQVWRADGLAAVTAQARERLDALSTLASRPLGDATPALAALGEEVARLVPPPVRERLGAERSPLVLHVDEALVDVPFELASWGGRALLERAPVSRRLRSGGAAQASDGEPHGAALLPGDPARLPAGAREAARIADLLWRRAGARLPATLLGGPRGSAAAVQDALRTASLIHFCGHTELDPPGWELGAGTLTPDDVAARPLGARLVVANSCVSHGFARAFVLAGARNYVGTWWRVADEAAASFALALYEELALGRSLGQALFSARTALRARDPLHWAAYVHYGDPDTRLVAPQALAPMDGQ